MHYQPSARTLEFTDRVVGRWRVLAVLLVGLAGMAGMASVTTAAAQTIESVAVQEPPTSVVVSPRSIGGVMKDTLRGGVDWLSHANPVPLVLEQGDASYYANRFHGRRTASGEPYDKNELTAAHKTLPFGTRVIVRSLQTGREVAVRIIDRGPHLKDRIIDLSHAAAVALGIQRHGVSEVQLIEKPLSGGER